MARKRPTQQQIDPRVVGGRYRSGYWRIEYTVTAIEFDAHGWLVSVTCLDDDGSIRTHCTAWDNRDRVISEPAA